MTINKNMTEVCLNNINHMNIIDVELQQTPLTSYEHKIKLELHSVGNYLLLKMSYWVIKCYTGIVRRGRITNLKMSTIYIS